MPSTLYLVSLPGSFRSGVLAPDRVLSMCLNRTNLWFRELSVFPFKLRIYTKRNCLKQNCFDI